MFNNNGDTLVEVGLMGGDKDLSEKRTFLEDFERIIGMKAQMSKGNDEDLEDFDFIIGKLNM